MHNNDPEIIEREIKRKDPHANSILETAPGWNEATASESEANIKAERHGGIPDAKKTLEYIKKRYHDEPKTPIADTPHKYRANTVGQTDDTSNPHTSADYERDEVSGPLGSKHDK
ncbi:uncharacterized protein EI90DRAFT_3286033 [Cantharellus anzutake]|uniref:uncharacterized protein n=1 Tax=Cantharellus anzutake TaxID=1750568 RepID=UPI00190533C4|nr:uncharacterized protein EI90DRAFT_3159685 [Cantharellus anzutake]XP_038922123.1 uncharacterized protein EI90DRAFT_3286033 [Cantharellus anzutake]KAF8313503.1 hypothetical protein EI90DRAFT_3159685 [Cantharellus anzutake]KAF8340761.1 hypothetical protein EI90DRAFT_3286033 [Cantharellus anzutake]